MIQEYAYDKYTQQGFYLEHRRVHGVEYLYLFPPTTTAVSLTAQGDPSSTKLDESKTDNIALIELL
jgi:hypothetical protein